MATLRKQKSAKEYDCSKCGSHIQKGVEYYRFSASRFQKLKPRCINCKPTRQEMTNSDFWVQYYDIDDHIQGLTIEDMEDAQAAVDDIVEQLEMLRDEQEEKLYNMPDQLQESETGQLLQERYDGVQEMVDELQSIDLEIDEEADEDEQEEEKNQVLMNIQAVEYMGS